ncbi:MAG: hypothetical protein FJY85_14300, partial [Deltaproteobacteria bacterium]|nr:hypothetical protein [Deltaproteobacteria bacterium]
MVPENILRLLWESVITPLNSLRAHYIDVNHFWLVNEGLSEGERTTYFRDTLDRFNELISLLPRMKADLAYIETLSGESIVSPESQIALRLLEKEYEAVDVALQHDESVYTRWKEVREEIRKARKESSRMDFTLYAKIFAMDQDGMPFHLRLTRPESSRSEVVRVLSDAISAVDSASRLVAAGLEEAARKAEELASGVEFHQIDEGRLHRAEVEVLRLAQELNNIQEALTQRRADLVTIIRTQNKTMEIDTVNPIPTYESLRTQAEQEIRGHEETLQGLRSFRDDWEETLSEWTGE